MRAFGLITVLLTLLFGCSESVRAAGHVVSPSHAPTYVIAGGKGTAQLFLNQQTGSPEAALSVLTLAAGAAVPEHLHQTSVEILMIQRGRVEMTIAGKTFRAAAGDAIYIPANTNHSAKVLGNIEALQAVQVYVGAGPEQRFAKGARYVAP